MGRVSFSSESDDLGNLNQMVEAVSRDGYVIAQEYLPAAAEGDTRLFMMNGEPLRLQGQICCLRRLRRGTIFEAIFTPAAQRPRRNRRRYTENGGDRAAQIG